MILDLYDSNYYIAYAIPIIPIILVLIVIYSNLVTVSFFLSHHNCVVSPSLLLNVIFCTYLLFPPKERVQKLIVTTYFKGSTLMIDNFSAISCLFFSQHNGVVSTSPLVIVIFRCFCLFTPLGESGAP